MQIDLTGEKALRKKNEDWEAAFQLGKPKTDEE